MVARRGAEVRVNPCSESTLTAIMLASRPEPSLMKAATSIRSACRWHSLPQKIPQPFPLLFLSFLSRLCLSRAATAAVRRRLILFGLPLISSN